MGVITTYICDVSGEQGSNKEDFVSVKIQPTLFNSNGSATYGYGDTNDITKFVHKKVALKLGLLKPKKDEEVPPEITFESKLTTLLKDYINDLVYDEVQSAVSNRG